MEKLTHIEVSEICSQLGMKSPKSIKQVFGGNIHNSWKIEFENKKIFVKRNFKIKKFLKFEEYCLKTLQKNINEEDLIIPKVLSYLNIENVEILVMEWIDMQNGDQKKLGKGLAKMHLKSMESKTKKFGFSIEGFIGTSDQKKGWEDEWSDCFVNLRIKPQLSMFDNNLLDTKNKKLILEKLKSELISHKPTKTLVHGDLWSGNIGVNQDGKGVIFDPASWWADCEVDIAMTRLFGGFQDEFYDQYYKIIPKKEGFEKRTTIYNFYHILNHGKMFGKLYLNQILEYIQEIMKM